MDVIRRLFYVFVVGFGFSVIPVPRFFFWSGIVDQIASFIHSIGFIMAMIAGIMLMVEISRRRR
ncbi:MAG: hypothetical protein H0Z33_10195 [Bacillaceae bacterium]|nr:hypothetical protein [Bacillaceae bacterium]